MSSGLIPRLINSVASVSDIPASIKACFSSCSMSEVVKSSSSAISLIIGFSVGSTLFNPASVKLRCLEASTASILCCFSSADRLGSALMLAINLSCAKLI